MRAGISSTAPFASAQRKWFFEQADTETRGVQTTPDCNEGLRWTVFKEHKFITAETMQKMYDWLASVSTADGSKTNGYRADNRIPQPLNGRTVWEHDSVPDDLASDGAGGYGALRLVRLHELADCSLHLPWGCAIASAVVHLAARLTCHDVEQHAF